MTINLKQVFILYSKEGLTVTILDLRPTQPLQWVPGVLTLEVKRPGRGA